MSDATDETPIVLNTDGWVELKGRGWMATFANHERENPRHLRGKEVIVTGRYRVTGVDTFAVPDWHPALLESYGLLLEFAGPAPESVPGAVTDTNHLTVPVSAIEELRDALAEMSTEFEKHGKLTEALCYLSAARKVQHALSEHATL